MFPRLPFTLKNFEKIHSGENEVFILFSEKTSYLLKKYRLERGFKLALKDEVDLMKFLSLKDILTPHFQSFESGNLIEILEGSYFTLQNLVQGQMFFTYDSDFYFFLGQTIRDFHKKVFQSEKKSFLSQYSFDSLFDERKKDVLSASFLEQKLLERLFDFRDLLKPHADKFFKENLCGFIHFDLHPGNIIFTQEGPCFIDWEEAGYGPALLDLASPLSHILKKENKEELKEALLEGYGVSFTQKEVSLVTMLKLFYYMSHLPKRLDILKEPKKIYERYLSYLEDLSLDL